MAGGQKLLIDTNVIIDLEDWREISPTVAKLQKLSSQYGCQLFIHEAALTDIQRDKNIDRRRVTLSKLEKFQRITGVRAPPRAELEARFGRISGPNDEVDVQLLYALHMGVSDFLITEDQGIHTRARRVSADFSDRVLTVADAVAWLVSEHEPKSVHLPLIEELPAHAIALDDPLFDSLREGYPEFDVWWKAKCIAEHRPCWVATIGNKMAGLIVRKDEFQEGRKILKLCTFKVAPEFRGEKLGELLLKQAIWFAQRNGYSSLYLTTFPEQSVLISVLEYYGFTRTGPDDRGEFRLEKPISNKKLTLDMRHTLFEMARLNYPRFISPPEAKAFCVPIRGQYHDMLFPELNDRRQSDLFEAMGLESSRPRTPGNTIRKIYLCRASTNQIEPGSLLFFYRSSAQPSLLSQSITTLGIAERVSQPVDLESLTRLTAKRSVYSPDQLDAMVGQGSRPLKAIDFLLIGHFDKPIFLHDLNALGVFGGHPPQSISKLTSQRYEKLKTKLDIGFTI